MGPAWATLIDKFRYPETCDNSWTTARAPKKGTTLPDDTPSYTVETTKTTMKEQKIAGQSSPLPYLPGFVFYHHHPSPCFQLCQDPPVGTLAPGFWVTTKVGCQQVLHRDCLSFSARNHRALFLDLSLSSVCKTHKNKEHRLKGFAGKLEVS